MRLTPTERHLVEVLVRNAGKLVSQRQLLEEVWGPEYGDQANYLRVHMAHVRRKLEPDPSRPAYFLTEAGVVPIRAARHPVTRPLSGAKIPSRSPLQPYGSRQDGRFDGLGAVERKQ